MADLVKILLTGVALTALASTAQAGGDDHFTSSLDASAHGSFSGFGSSWGGSTQTSAERSWGRWGGWLTSGMATGFDSLVAGMASGTIRTTEGYRPPPREQPKPSPAKPRPAAPRSTPTPQVDMGTVPSAVMEITYSPPQVMHTFAPTPPTMPDLTASAPIPDQQRRKRTDLADFENALDSIGKRTIDSHKQHSLEKRAAATLNVFFGAVKGAILGGKGLSSKAAAVEGAVLGGVVAETYRRVTGKTPFDDFIHDAFTTNPREFRAGKRVARNMSAQQRRTVVDAVRDLVREDRQERQKANRERNARRAERKASRAADRARP